MVAFQKKGGFSGGWLDKISLWSSRSTDRPSIEAAAVHRSLDRENLAAVLLEAVVVQVAAAVA